MQAQLCRKNQYSLLFWFLLVMVLVQIVFCGWYADKVFFSVLNSDSAGDLIYAKQIADEGHYIFSDNWYQSTEIKVVQLQLIMVPLFKLGLSYRFVMVITDMVLVGLMALSAYVSMRMLRLSPEMSMLAALLFIFPGLPYSQFVLLHPCFNTFLILSILSYTVTFCAYEQSKDGGLRKRIYIYILGLLVGINGRKALVMIALPCVAFPLLTWIVHHWNQRVTAAELLRGIKQNKAPLLFGLAALMGQAIYSLILVKIFGESGAVFRAGTGETLSLLLPQVPYGLIKLAGLGSGVGSNLLRNVELAASALFSASLYLALGLTLKNDKDKVHQTIARFAAFSLAYGFFLLCNLNYAEGDTFIWRYLGLMAYPLFLALPVYLEAQPRFSLARVLCVVICIVTFTLRLYAPAQAVLKTDRNNPCASGAVAYLRYDNYHFGAATFWNANVNTIKTDGEVTFQSVYNDEDFGFYKWLCPKTNSDRDLEFYLLTAAEYKQRQANHWATPGKLVYQDEEFVVFSLREV